MNSKGPVERPVSGGGVVWRRGAVGLEVVLCGRSLEKRWVLPKGTPDVGETIEETALREVREETGLEVRLGTRLGSIRYWYTADGLRYHKAVHHWLMEPTGGDLSLHDHEFDQVEWYPIAEALRLLTHENERRVVREAARALGEAV